MNGAVFYATKYGSTAEYAKWIGDATGLPICFLLSRFMNRRKEILFLFNQQLLDLLAILEVFGKGFTGQKGFVKIAESIVTGS